MNKEQHILQLIKMNPFITQQELSRRVGLSRPAVANYIANLTKQGEIKGRAYILREASTITCIGGANVDRKARSIQDVRLYSSNPVNLTESCGGVARNVAENLSRLGLKAALLTTVGEDKEGQWLLQAAIGQGIDVSQVWRVSSERTGTYTALLDRTGEMVVSMADMNIYDKITPAMLEERWAFIAASQAVFLDTNLPADCLQFVLKRGVEQNIPLYLDPVSATKAQKLPASLEGIEVIFPNREEAELLASAAINSVEDCSQACDKIKARGVENVVITLGEEGVYFSSDEESGHLLPFEVPVTDVTGAGDAFTASVIYGLTQNEPLAVACRLGLAAAALTVQTESSVSSILQPEKIYEMIKEPS